MNSRRLLVVIPLMLGVAVGFGFLPVREWIFQLEASVRSLGPWGPLALSLGYVLATVFLIPGSAITVGAAGLFGFKIAFFAVLLGANAGALCSFLLARTFLRGWVLRWAEANPKFRSLDHAIDRQGFKMVLLLRLSPAFPFTWLNYLLGLTAVRTETYLLANLIGMLPGMLLYVYIGAAARETIAGSMGGADFYQQAFRYVGLLATLILVVLVTRTARRALREAEIAAERQWR